jgi:hypothetical protein
VRQSDQYELITFTSKSKLHSGTPNLEVQFIKVGQGFHGVLLGFWVFSALRWVMLEKVSRYVCGAPPLSRDGQS